MSSGLIVTSVMTCLLLIRVGSADKSSSCVVEAGEDGTVNDLRPNLDSDTAEDFGVHCGVDLNVAPVCLAQDSRKTGSLRRAELHCCGDVRDQAAAASGSCLKQ